MLQYVTKRVGGQDEVEMDVREVRRARYCNLTIHDSGCERCSYSIPSLCLMSSICHWKSEGKLFSRVLENISCNFICLVVAGQDSQGHRWLRWLSVNISEPWGGCTKVSKKGASRQETVVQHYLYSATEKAPPELKLMDASKWYHPLGPILSVSLFMVESIGDWSQSK
jgi:hypothetical protein